MNQLKSLDKLNMYSGAKKNGEESIKKLVDINNKLEGGGKNKLMSFMRSDSDKNTLEQFSKKENEQDKIEKEKNENKDELVNKEKEKVDKPKRVKNSLKKLRGLDI